MTTHAAEPGTRLGGRYRLEDRIATGAGWAAWKAIDETLARAVTVFTFAPGYPRVTEVVTAARAASRLADPRLAHVFDVEDTWDRAYIVMEWAAGETLGDLLTRGPVEPYRAARIIAEAAGALACAHASGVAHMCLSPGSLRWSPTGEVKVVGLGIDAALSGVVSDDPVLADTRGLGRLLYAALTGCWPGPDSGHLRPAPMAEGLPRSPREVVADIPPALSDVTCQALQLRTAADSGPLTTPADLARALRAAIRQEPPASPAPPWRKEAPGHQNETARYSANAPYGPPWQDASADNGRRQPARQPADEDWDAASGHAGDTWPPQDGHGRRARGHRSEPAGRSGSRRRAPARIPKAAVVAAGVLLVAVLAGFLWQGGGSTPPAPPGRKPSTPSTASTVLTPRTASGFDPLTPVSRDRGNEMTSLAGYAIDDKPQTSWDSQQYYSAQFGGYKSGSGLLIDMGQQVRFTSVKVTFNSQPGANVELLVGNSSARTPQNLASMKQVAARQNVTGTQTFTISGSVSGRYLVIWYTSLPPLQGRKDRFMAQIFNVAISGAVVRAAA